MTYHSIAGHFRHFFQSFGDQNFGQLLLILTGFALPLVTLFASQQMPVLLIFILVALYGAQRPSYGTLKAALLFEGRQPVSLLLFALLLVALVSALWSIVPADSYWRSAKLLGLLVIFLLAAALSRPPSPPPKDSAAQQKANSTGALHWGILACFILVLVEWFFDVKAMFPGLLENEVERANTLNRPSLILCVLIWPAIWAVHRRWGALAGLALLVLAMALFFPSSSTASKIALGVGAGTVGLAVLVPLITRALLVAGFTLSLIITPWITVDESRVTTLISTLNQDTQFSAVHRLIIWHFTAEQIEKKPLLGWGLDSARAIPGGGASPWASPAIGEDLRSVLIKPNDFDGVEVLPLHPHNSGLQILLELGVFGAIATVMLMAGIAWVTTAGGGRLASVRQAYCLAAVTSWLTVASLSIGLWQSWWLATSILAFLLLRKGGMEHK